MTYGLTEDGFVTKTAEIIRDAINARIRARFGTSLDLSDEDPLGFFVGIVSLELAENWEVNEAINAARTREGATGPALDDVGLIIGSFRPEDRASIATLTLTGVPTTVVAAISRSETVSTGAVFAHDSEVTIAAATAWANTTAYVVNDRRTNGGNVYLCITAGTSAGSGGPTTTSADITDGTVHWRYLGEGTGYVDVESTCSVAGATVALSGDIAQITTPVSGWQGVVNILDATVGELEASDEEFRLIQEIDLATPGSSTVDAIREALLNLDDVTSVKIFVNNEDVEDVDGVPAHAIEALVQGGTNQDIWDALLANVAAGIETYGNEPGTATDSTGTVHDTAFSRPEEIDIYVELDVYFPTGEAPADAAAQVQTAIVTYGDAQDVGRNPNVASIIRAAMGVEGVFDVLNVAVDFVDPPVDTSVTVGTRQIAVYDSSRITVNVLTGAP